ncbi:SAM-dependent methyltransferase [Hydrogenophaga pseudoflava]|uniref:SAM-dependent methyltransferase n=1 Tax=Hydrogenophaga pseudoflava TaxID=47421 RepID=UPI0027E4EE74|nr:class I SAM-dependent methyltransferase [Hydrogenophaga pseudoflava]MDQ7745897.1 class I SAM-dependent methyltransferase [Hydrogenophaga pseudoflava]
MSRTFFPLLLDEATKGFRSGGPFAHRYARGKLGTDPIFREMLRRGLLPADGRLLDLGCGQGSLFAWLLAARRLYEQGQWHADWPAPPRFRSMRGVELMQNDVDRAADTFGSDHPVVRVEQGDMNLVDFGQADVVTILDALHYFDHENQTRVLRRIHAALPVQGLFLTRIGDASAGLPFHISNWVDHVVTFARGHRLPRLYCRTLADWTALLTGIGFAVQSAPMSEGKPFANVMLVCRKHG